MDAVDRLQSIEDIRRLKARYFRDVDTRNWAGLAELFTPDAVFDRGFGHALRDPATGAWATPVPPSPELVHGRAAIVAMVRRAVDGTVTVHHGHDPEIDILSADTASAIWAMSDELRDHQGRLILAGRGHYEDTYRRTAGSWRIASSRLTRLALTRGDGELGQNP
jgi:hypothetical protein